MKELIKASDLADLAAAAKVPLPAEVVAEEDKFIVRVMIRNKLHTVAAISTGKTLHERKFASLNSAGSFLMKSNIQNYQVNTARYKAGSTLTRAPSSQARMRKIHQIAAEHNDWLRKEVEASRADARPTVSNDAANKRFAENLHRLRSKETASAAKVSTRKKSVAA